MQFSTTTIAFFLALVTSVLGDTHASCTCHNGDSYNWRITINACTSYNDAGYEWGGSVYDTPTGRCDADSGAAIAGDQWTAACQAAATAGFACADGVGTCFASADEVNGWC